MNQREGELHFAIIKFKMTDVVTSRHVILIGAQSQISSLFL